MLNADPAELDKFGDLAHRWWDPNSEFKPLHDINPLRLDWIDGTIGLHGKRILDVGCGGGLLSGCAVAARHMLPDCRVIGVEPAAGDDATRSFRTRTLQSVHNPDTIADGARTSSLGELFDEMRRGRFQMALVVDEYGSLEGLVTMADLIEELFGNLVREFDLLADQYAICEGDCWQISAT